jgi:hypothetical protein
LIGGLVAIGGLIGIFRLRAKGRRPTGAELMEMSDPDFASFIRASGLKTVTTAGLAALDGRAD